MLKPSMKNHRAQQIALVAIFAALYYVLSLIPIPAIPTTAGLIQINLAALVASVFGIILGPYLGAGAAFLGTTVTWGLTGMSPFGLPFLISPMLNALIVGLVFYKKWKYAFAVFGIMIVAFLFTEPVTPLTGTSVLVGFNIPVSNWYIALSVLFDKIIALALILPLAFLGKKMSLVYGSAFFFLLAFVGNQADNMWGSLIFTTHSVYNGIFGYQLADVQLFFVASPFLYPIIRIVQAAIAMIIIVPLVRVLHGTNWLWSEDNILTDSPKPLVTTPTVTPL